jgi:NAD(P)-dependent dehydrogenase (short-subunit alcohol dehydrogenase family)
MSGASDRTVALVTGAAQGIGLGIARSLASASYKVVLADVEYDLVRIAADELGGSGARAIGEPLDVTRSEDWARVIEKSLALWGGIDLVVNCAGISPRGTVESTDEDLWERTLAINLKGAWLGIKAAMPSLRSRRGTIVNIGSVRATRPISGLFSYVVSKAGLWGLTQQVAVECLNDGVTCNMVAPGWVETPNEDAGVPSADASQKPPRASAAGWTHAPADSRTPSRKASGKWASRRGPMRCDDPVKMLTQTLEDGPHGLVLGSIGQLVGIVALVEQLLSTIPLVPDVDVISFGQGNQRTPSRGRSTGIRIGRVRPRQFGDRSLVTADRGDSGTAQIAALAHVG